MIGSGTIRVVKRDRSVEYFDARKLAAAIWRTMQYTDSPFEHASSLVEAIELYLHRNTAGCISAQGIFELTVRALRHVHLSAAASAAENHHQWRDTLREQVRMRQDDGRLTFWDKAWLCEFARRSWHVSPATARTLAGEVELDVLQRAEPVVSRRTVIDVLNELVSQYGLADAVPV